MMHRPPTLQQRERGVQLLVGHGGRVDTQQRVDAAGGCRRRQARSRPPLQSYPDGRRHQLRSMRRRAGCGNGCPLDRLSSRQHSCELDCIASGSRLALAPWHCSGAATREGGRDRDLGHQGARRSVPWCCSSCSNWRTASSSCSSDISRKSKSRRLGGRGGTVRTLRASRSRLALFIHARQ
jgi:hypothetical protein